MALNIKDPVTEEIIAEVAELAHESKTHAVRVALQERRERLRAVAVEGRRARNIEHFLRDEAWPQIPDDVLGQRISRAEREDILGYGPEGV